MKRLLQKRYPGVIAADIGLSPFMFLCVAVTITIFLSVIYYGISYLFFSEVMIKGARAASINPNVSQVQTAIYQGVTHVLPEQRRGITLFSPSDITINASDGEFVTVSATYRVMLPGAQLYANFGGDEANWIAPAFARFSFYREY